MILDLCVDVFDDEGVGVSTAKIAKAVGVSNGTLFNYFPTKQDLIDALYLRLKLDLAAALGDIDPELSLQEQSQTLALRWFDWAAAKPARNRVAALLHQSGLAGEEAIATAAAAFANSGRILNELADSGLLVDLPIAYVAQLMQNHVEIAVQVGLTETERITAFNALWNGITNNKLAQTTS